MAFLYKYTRFHKKNRRLYSRNIGNYARGWDRGYEIVVEDINSKTYRNISICFLTYA